MCLHVNKVNNALQTCMSLWYFRWASCLSWTGVVSDFFWWHLFQHDLGLGGQGGQYLGLLGWRTCVHLGNWIQLHWEVDQNSGGRGQQGLWANFRKWVDNLWGTCQGFNWSAVNDLLQGVLQGFPWSTVGHGVLWAHHRGSSSSLGWRWQV